MVTHVIIEDGDNAQSAETGDDDGGGVGRRKISAKLRPLKTIDENMEMQSHSESVMSDGKRLRLDDNVVQPLCNTDSALRLDDNVVQPLYDTDSALLLAGDAGSLSGETLVKNSSVKPVTSCDESFDELGSYTEGLADGAVTGQKDKEKGLNDCCQNTDIVQLKPAAAADEDEVQCAVKTGDEFELSAANHSADRRLHSVRGDSVRDDSVRGDSHRGDNIRDDSHRGDNDRGDSVRGDNVRDDSVRGDSDRDDDAVDTDDAAVSSDQQQQLITDDDDVTAAQLKAPSSSSAIETETSAALTSGNSLQTSAASAHVSGMDEPLQSTDDTPQREHVASSAGECDGNMSENARESPDSPSAGGRAAVSDVMTDDVTHSPGPATTVAAAAAGRKFVVPFKRGTNTATAPDSAQM